MTKLHTEAGGYDLFCRADWFYYLVNLSKNGSRDYQYFQNDLTRNVAITEQEFNAAKYGPGIVPFEHGEEVVPLPDGGTLRCFFHSSTVRIFNPAGELLRTLPAEVTAGCTIYSIALDADGQLWTAEPSFHYVGQYDLATGQRLWGLGGNWDPTEFNHPEDLAIYGEHAFISDMGNQRLVVLNTRTKVLGTYRTFEQPVWQYRQFQGQELVRLDDGIYLL
ncbi:hypothetical protein [Hymenobacter antarcticus]|uniref:NHL repeat-containing protein n=1 Tax=Hymenobacter antarcticus TaxID=486270 RepID=A0ABP7PUK9_9BACT